VESGCGIGTISKILAHRKSAKYILYDKCPKMVELCQMNIKTNPTVLILQDDITTSLLKPNSDLIFGHGVLEHFTDNDIAKILNLQILLSKYVVHYVPSAKYTSPSFGDERLLSKFTWQLRFKPDHIIEFNDGYDLILIWKGKCS
jgi:SAM-dependent methyltransferase